MSCFCHTVILSYCHTVTVSSLLLRPELVKLVLAQLVRVALVLALPGQVVVLPPALVQGDQGIHAIVSIRHRNPRLLHLLLCDAPCAVPTPSEPASQRAKARAEDDAGTSAPRPRAHRNRPGPAVCTTPIGSIHPPLRVGHHEPRANRTYLCRARRWHVYSPHINRVR